MGNFVAGLDAAAKKGKTLNVSELMDEWKRDEAQPFSGWDFSYLQDRVVESDLPWSYIDHAKSLLRGRNALIDLGTGGGERLLQLQEYWPPKVAATEDYEPNYLLAKNRLERHGVEVIKVALERDSKLPLPSESFDIVLNRHSGFNCSEIGRILSAGGIFYTQQVHGLSLHDLIEEFGAVPQWPDATPQLYVPLLIENGFTINYSEEYRGPCIIKDVGALVYFLKAIPWLVPGFIVERYKEKLLSLHQKIENEGKLEYEQHYYVIKATKHK